MSRKWVLRIGRWVRRSLGAGSGCFAHFEFQSSESSDNGAEFIVRRGDQARFGCSSGDEPAYPSAPLKEQIVACYAEVHHRCGVVESWAFDDQVGVRFLLEVFSPDQFFDCALFRLPFLQRPDETVGDGGDQFGEPQIDGANQHISVWGGRVV